MYTEPEIKESANRSYIEFYYNGTRLREYNANKLGLSILPNKAKTKANKHKLLKKLKFEFDKALEKGWNPFELPSNPEPILSLKQAVDKIVAEKSGGNYSRTYIRDIVATSKQFLAFLTETELNSPSDRLTSNRIAQFLDGYNTSNRNYMNKRQYLNVIFPGTIIKTHKKKTVEKLHEVYSEPILKTVLHFLRTEYPRLHLTALPDQTGYQTMIT